MIDKKREDWLIDNQSHEDSMTAQDHQNVQKSAEILYGKLLKNLNRKEINVQYLSELLDIKGLSEEQYSNTETSDENWESLASGDPTK
ncbi:MAG: hypothetical protein EBS18_04075, partial [Actinobacteria bacterium]|nr:hypothetical protein [Actinomycetota bacterium]